MRRVQEGNRISLESGCEPMLNAMNIYGLFVTTPQPTTAAERRVLRWLGSAALAITVTYLCYTWWHRAHDCQTHCRATMAGEGTLRFNGGGRLNLGTDCECAAQE